MNDKSALLEQLRIDRSEKPGSPRWPWMLGLALAVLLGALVWIWLRTRSVVTVRTAVAKAVAAQQGEQGSSLLDASGYVVALREATVSAKSIYKVDDVLVQEGQAVKRDEIIARLDDTNTRAALEQARAQVNQLSAALEAARVAAEDAQPTYTRNEAQMKEGLISPETFESAKAAYDSARAALAVAEQNLAVAKSAVAVAQRYEDDTIIRSPFDGVVTVKSAQPGEIVSPQFSGGGGIAKVVDMGSLEVDVDVSENFINRVHAEQPAVITLNAYPDWRIPAAVIAVIPTADRSKATVKVRVAFKQKDARVVPEMGARVSFLEDAPASASAASATVAAGVIVPLEAVQSDTSSGNQSATVYVVDGESVDRRSVQLGERRADGQVIRSGLEPGAVVAIGDLGKLADKTRVRVEP